MVVKMASAITSGGVLGPQQLHSVQVCEGGWSSQCIYSAHGDNGFSLAWVSVLGVARWRAAGKCGCMWRIIARFGMRYRM